MNFNVDVPNSNPLQAAVSVTMFAPPTSGGQLQDRLRRVNSFSTRSSLDKLILSAPRRGPVAKKSLAGLRHLG